jgi:hypothetical protein
MTHWRLSFWRGGTAPVAHPCSLDRAADLPPREQPRHMPTHRRVRMPQRRADGGGDRHPACALPQYAYRAAPHDLPRV